MATLNSMSSRSFRKMILIDSITALLKREPVVPPTPAPTRNSSDCTTAEESSISGSISLTRLKKHGGVEEKHLGLEPIRTNANGHRISSLTMEELMRFRSPCQSQDAPDDPFAGGVEGGVTFKSLSWWQAGVLMVAETISLGILALPAALAELGMVPGIILLVFLGAMASYSGYVIGQFKLAHRSIHSMADAGNVLFGRFGREILEFGQVVFIIFIMAAHLITFGIAMNSLTNHGTCTITFLATGAVLSFLLGLKRKLKDMTWLSAASFLSILGAVVFAMVVVGIEKPRTSIPDHAPIRVWPRPDLTFHGGLKAVLNMCFAYAGHVAFFSFISELKHPQDFPKALTLLQISDISMYLVTAIVMYYFVGDNVKSPALNSLRPLMKQICYGIAMVTIIVAGVINGAVGAKYIYVRLLRNRKDDIMHEKTFRARGTWAAINAVMWLVSWLLAEALPVFDDLLGLASALFATWFTFGLPAMFFMSMNLDINWRTFSVKVKTRWNSRKSLLLAINVLLLVAAIALCGLGLWSSGMNIKQSQMKDKPFTCKAKAGTGL